MTSLITATNATLALIDNVVRALAGIALLIITATIFVNAAGRYTAGVSFLGGEELARLLTVWITFLAAYSMLRRDGHVTIDLVLRVVPPGVQRFLRGAIAFTGTLTMTYLAWRSWQLTAFSLGSGQMGTTLPVPRGLFFMPVCVGAVLMAIAFAEKLIRAVTDTLPPLPSLVGEEEPAEPAPAAADPTPPGPSSRGEVR